MFWLRLFGFEPDDTYGCGHAGAGLFNHAHHLEDHFFLLFEERIKVASGLFVVGEDLDLRAGGCQADDPDVGGGCVDVGAFSEDRGDVVRTFRTVE